ncbi:MAG: putative Ig domain-containing protein, partial [Proteobacteria bacterium]|nr:putative Ig domain-containing protein [Pseudomonadota bacterium]
MGINSKKKTHSARRMSRRFAAILAAGLVLASASASAAPPTLDPIGNRSVDELSELAFTATASDTDIPAQTLTFSLDPGAPAGAGITSGGAFTWTPSEAQGPGNYDVTVRVTDDGAPNEDDFETITITVGEVNVAPVLGLIADQGVQQESLLTFTATATDADDPANTLTFSLDPGAPTGAAITSGGVFTWTPTTTQGPGDFDITVRVTDDGVPSEDDFETITVTVGEEANVAPVLALIGDRSVDELTALAFTATATDANDPAQTLTFSLDPGAPAGAGITSGGAFTWTPSEAQGPGSYDVTVRVTDDGAPNEDDFETIT